MVEQLLCKHQVCGSNPHISTTFDPTERALDKQRQRDQDDEDLRAGRVTAEELRRVNGFFSFLDLSSARIKSIGGKPVDQQFEA